MVRTIVQNSNRHHIKGGIMTQTESDLKAFWRRTGLSFSGHRFSDDIKVPMIARCLQRGVEAQRKKHQAPTQPSLNF